MTTNGLKVISTAASGGVGEFVTEARLDAHNAALAARGVMAEPCFAWTRAGSSPFSKCQVRASPTRCRGAIGSSSANP